MIIGNKPSDEDTIKINDFKEKYYHLFPDYLQEEFDEKMLLGYTNNNDFVNQVYCYLNINPKEITAYTAFYNLLKNNFNLDNLKILEVGSGTIPILTNYFKHIDLIDKKVTKEFYQDKNYQECIFDEKYNISKYDLIIGYNPCQATESIIRNAIKNGKDFCIALCGCCFLPKEYTERTDFKWHEYLFDLANTLGKDKYLIKKVYFASIYQIEYPIIIGKKVN